jgi:hypothetical protein
MNQCASFHPILLYSDSATSLSPIRFKNLFSLSSVLFIIPSQFLDWNVFSFLSYYILGPKFL